MLKIWPFNPYKNEKIYIDEKLSGGLEAFKTCEYKKNNMYGKDILNNKNLMILNLCLQQNNN